MNQLVPHVPDQRPSLPNDTAILVLGICSLVFGFCYGVVGFGMAIAALIMSKQSLRQYRSSPNAWSATSISNVNAGRTCAIIGLIISSLIFLAIIAYIVFYIMILGVALSSPLWA